MLLCLPEGLPVDLQYLPEDKTREEDPDIRKMLVETLLLVGNGFICRFLVHV